MKLIAILLSSSLLLTSAASAVGVDRIIDSKYSDKDTIFTGNDGGVKIEGGRFDWSNAGFFGLGTATPERQLSLKSQFPTLQLESDFDTRKWRLGTGFITNSLTLQEVVSLSQWNFASDGNFSIATGGAGITIPNAAGTALFSMKSLAGNLLKISAAGNAAGQIEFQAGALGSDSLQLLPDGTVHVRLQTINATGDVCATSAGSGLRALSSCASSKRYKDNIRTISNAERDSIYTMRGVNFDWKAANGGHNDFGLIAEEVDLIMPQLVPKDDGGLPQSVNYKHMVGLLVEVVKDLKARIVVLEAKH